MNFSFRLSLDFHRRFDSENLFNLLMFLPFGFLCPGKRTGSGWLRTAAAGLGLSCAIELLQPFFGRSFDCNDILLNALGALIGAVLSGLLAGGMPHGTGRCLCDLVTDKTAPMGYTDISDNDYHY